MKRELTRREALKLGAAATGAAVIGCGNDGGRGDGQGDGDAGPSRGDAGRDPDAGPPAPTGLLGSIDTFVVLCMENRSFDHYLGARKLVEGIAVDGLEATMKNPGPSGDVFAYALADFTTESPGHTWDAAHLQYNDGAMDGFVATHEGELPQEAMGYMVRADLPVMWGMADEFCTCDRWFASVLGPTWPNRYYLHGATSNGVKSNLPAFGFRSVFSQMSGAGVTHANYFSDIAWAAGAYQKLSGNIAVEQFFDHAAAGTLPNFALIDPGFFGAGANDDHPDRDVRLGQAFLSTVYGALRASPQWNRCMLAITYDEHGGFFDHVPPPEVDDERQEFRRLGVRVPSLVAGPFVRRGEVVSTVLEHSSVVATLSRRFGLTPLNQRAAAAADLSSCIDPALIGDPQPGPVLPPPPAIDLRRLREVDAELRAAGRPTSHTELWDLAESGAIPRALDRRDRSLEIAETWLAVGERLGAVELRR